MAYTTFDAIKIQLANAVLTASGVLSAVEVVNASLAKIEIDADDMPFFDIIDFRMLSGLIGEMFVGEMAKENEFLRKNPNIDGYPDLLDVSSTSAEKKFSSLAHDKFLDFSYGGLEVKNTFGVKKGDSHIEHRTTRVQKIHSRLVWKAHHRKTNNLIALHSDYVDRIPQIVSVFFASDLNENDWTDKKHPKGDSTMTSFCQTKPSAFSKLLSGLVLYREEMGLERIVRPET